MADYMKEYEEQFLIELISSVINDEPMTKGIREPDWNQIYKFAYYHHIANTIYPVLLSMEAKRLPKWKAKCYEEYQQAVIMMDLYEEASIEIFKHMEKNKIHCLKTAETVLAGLYSHDGIRCPEEVLIIKEPGHDKDVEKIMVELGYRRIVNKGKKRIITRTSKGREFLANSKEMIFQGRGGVRFVFSDTFIFTDKYLRKYFREPVINHNIEEGKKYIHILDPAEFYVYYIAVLAEKFAFGRLQLRDIVDLWVLYLEYYSQLEWKAVNECFDGLEIGLFADYIVKLAATWFGEQSFTKDAEKLFAMQKYIMSKGAEGRRDNSDFVPLMEEIADIDLPDPKKEERKRIIKMWFPDIDYMIILYPVLSRYPKLIGVFWIRRIISGRIRVRRASIRAWLSDENHMPQKFRRTCFNLGQRIKILLKKINGFIQNIYRLISRTLDKIDLKMKSLFTAINDKLKKIRRHRK